MADKKKKPSAKRSKQDKRSLRTNIILICSLVVFTATVIYFGVRYDVFTSPFGRSPNTMELPSIDTQIKSSSTGESFYVSADVMLEFENPNTGGQKDVTQIVSDAISGMDYDKITSEGNVDYIKESILSGLSDHLPSNTVTNIYFTDFQSSRTPIDRTRKGTWDLLFPKN